MKDGIKRCIWAEMQRFIPFLIMVLVCSIPMKASAGHSNLEKRIKARERREKRERRENVLIEISDEAKKLDIPGIDLRIYDPVDQSGAPLQLSWSKAMNEGLRYKPLQLRRNPSRADIFSRLEKLSLEPTLAKIRYNLHFENDKKTYHQDLLNSFFEKEIQNLPFGCFLAPLEILLFYEKQNKTENKDFYWTSTFHRSEETTGFVRDTRYSFLDVFKKETFPASEDPFSFASKNLIIIDSAQEKYNVRCACRFPLAKHRKARGLF